LRRLLTDGFLRAEKPPKEGRTEIIDLRCPGLVFRVTASGVRTWAFRFRDRRTGKQGRAKIGAYPSTTLEAARVVAVSMQKTVDAAGNPTQERRTGGPDSFKALAARYLAAVKDPQSDWFKRSHSSDERNLRKHVLPHWAERRFAAVTRADVVGLTTGIVAAGTPTLANRVQSLVSNIFSFALDGGELQAHPCFRLRKRGKERVGSRVLTDAEMRLFWRDVIEPPPVMRTGLGLRFILATGARVSEVAAMSRLEIEHIAVPDAAVWVIPGERTKNSRDHAVPLSPLARECVLGLLAMIEPAEQWLFPTRSKKRKGPMRGNTLTQAMDFFANRLTGDDDAIRTWQAERPTPHDLRRTLATRLAALGIPREIRDRCLNHISNDVGTKHYNRYEFLAEKRDAFTRWSTVLGSILHGTSATVVPLAAARIGARNGA
jgi:integrase